MKFLLLLLYVLSFIGCSYGEEEDCFCKDSIKYHITEEANIPLTIYLTEENYITLHLTYKDKDEDQNMDFITVKRKSYEITKIRENKDDLTESVDLSSPLLLEWININITVKENEVYMKPYIDKFVAEFPLQQIVIASKNMASCKNGKPKWKIMQDQPAIIPLNSLFRSRISIISAKEFSPIININYLFGSKDISTNRSGVILVASGSQLTESSYNYTIDNLNDNIEVIHGNGECGTLIASLKLSTILTNITAKTLDEDFTITLEPNINPIKSCDIPSNKLEVKNTPTTPEGKGNTSTIILVIVIVLIIIGSLTTILYMRKKKNHKYAKLKIQKDNLNKEVQGEKEKELSDLRNEKEKELSDLRNEKEKELSDLRNEKDEKTKLLMSEMLWDAAKIGNIALIQKAMLNGGDVNYQINSETPLAMACKEGHLSVVQKLLEAFADTELSNNNGSTALHVACWKGNTPIVHELLKAGANRYIKQLNNGETPFDTAKRFNHRDVIIELQKDRAQSNQANKK